MMTADGPTLVLGCGPAGLLSAYAVELLGGEPVIMSRRVKSPLAGAMYLHQPIPGLTGGKPDGVIRTIRRGTAEGYAKKVYGDPAAPTSWEKVRPEHAVWDLRAVYDQLWDRYQGRIIDSEITRTDLHECSKTFSLVISTIPATQLCAPEWRRAMEGIDHEFKWETMYVMDWAPPDLPDNTVVYSGDPSEPWYRASRVFKHTSAEMTPHSTAEEVVEYADPPPPGGHQLIELKKGIKVVSNTCDCFPDIKRVGRYGTWTKNYLTHQAFEDATALQTEAFGAG